MSDKRINIRFLFWYFQVTYNWKPSISFGQMAWKHKKMALSKPVEIFEWNLFPVKQGAGDDE